jgi:molybdopterin-containing oxidoreductase family iron-sulfur binding subunit
MSGRNDTDQAFRGIEHASFPEAFDAVKADEFPHRDTLDQIDRRSLLKFAGATALLSGLTAGCRIQPPLSIVPLVDGQPGTVTGVDKHFATTATLGGYGFGVVVRQYEGRPVKIEGNPKHPSSLGSIDPKTLAEIAVLYDPDRSQFPTKQGDPGAWEEFFRNARAKLAEGGAALLTPNVSSPTLAALIEEFLQATPGAKWYQYEAANDDNAHEGSILAFGRPLSVTYDFSKADVVLSLDSDFLCTGPGAVRHSRDFATRRQADSHGSGMCRLYVVECSPTPTGVAADHRFRAKPSEIMGVAKAVAAGLGVSGATASASSAVGGAALRALVEDLRASAGRSIVVAGRHQPPAVHALCHAINSHLGNMGSTVKTVEPVLAKPVSNTADIMSLAAAMDQGKVKSLFILGGNPVYDAPADAKFAERLSKVPFSAHLSLHRDETSSACLWSLPAAHFLESWGDARAVDGTVSPVQPLIEPLYGDALSPIELVDRLLGRARSGLDAVKEQWSRTTGATGWAFDDLWKTALADGILKGTESKEVDAQPVPGLAGGLKDTQGGGIELVVLPDPYIHDGRYANVGWLQELPKPVTNLTWDNAAHMSPETAKRLGVGQPQKALGIVPFTGWADTVKVSAQGYEVELPVYVHMGMADDTVLVHMGYGRTQAGQIGTKGDPADHGGGFDVNPFRTSLAPCIVPNAQVAKSRLGAYPLANTQYHNMLDVTVVDSDRHLIREATVAEFEEHHEHAFEGAHHGEKKPGEPDYSGRSIYQRPDQFYSKDNYQWAMTIDLGLCTGCNACVTACQAENNIPVVGKFQVMKGREMHWIRIDRYYRPRKGQAFDEKDPAISFQPLTCMQCELAPCEPVCPVAATVHSHEGINQMVYNRCVGTRYCSNNCPYKVRRFNFLHYTRKTEDVPVLKLLQNPDVTVRGRGVMEKCTYCVHRINHARIEAKKAGRLIRDGEVVTACEQACPTRAIVFGSISDPESRVSKSRASKRNYILLEETLTRPRTSYLGRVYNPNPEALA